MKALILLVIALNLTGCATRQVLTHEKNFWLDESSEYRGVHGIYYCKANDQGDMKDSHPVCFEAIRKTLKDQNK